MGFNRERARTGRNPTLPGTDTPCGHRSLWLRKPLPDFILQEQVPPDCGPMAPPGASRTMTASRLPICSCRSAGAVPTRWTGSTTRCTAACVRSRAGTCAASGRGTLGTTGLVHETYLKLADQTRVQWRTGSTSTEWPPRPIASESWWTMPAATEPSAAAASCSASLWRRMLSRMSGEKRF